MATVECMVLLLVGAGDGRWLVVTDIVCVVADDDVAQVGQPEIPQQLVTPEENEPDGQLPPSTIEHVVVQQPVRQMPARSGLVHDRLVTTPPILVQDGASVVLVHMLAPGRQQLVGTGVGAGDGIDIVVTVVASEELVVVGEAVCVAVLVSVAHGQPPFNSQHGVVEKVCPTQLPRSDATQSGGLPLPTQQPD